MLNSEVAKLVGQLLVAVLGGGVVVAAIQNWLSPKAKAETRQIAQSVARQEVDDRIQNLKDSVTEAVSRADEAEKRADAQQERANKLAERLSRVQASVESAHEQLDLQSDQMAELREVNKQLKAQNEMLSESLHLADQHARRYFADRGEPVPHDWPRTLPLPEGANRRTLRTPAHPNGKERESRVDEAAVDDSA